MTINITLDSKHKLQSDSKNWILVCEDKNIGFFQTFDALIKEYYSRRLRTSNCKTASDINLAVKRLLEGSERLSEALYKQTGGRR